MTKTIFIFAYYSYKDPIFQSAVLPYFAGLSKSNNFKFVLLTFEQKRFQLSKTEASKIRKRLFAQNILWYRTYWHSGKFKLVKKSFDFLWGIAFSVFLVLRYNAKIIYSEGFPGAIIGHFLSTITFKPHIVHTFEPHSEYMVEAGVWNKDSWEYKLSRKYESKVAANCAVILTATNKMITKLENIGIKGEIYRVPSCVDTNIFRFDPQLRAQIRRNHNIRDNECVLTYLGKFGGMYMETELFDFYRVCKENSKIKFKFFLLTSEEESKLFDWIQSRDLIKEDFVIKFVKKEEVPAYLSASDFGVVAVRQKPSKVYCSPIKDGEYWSCGLPIIIPEGISDDYLFATQHKIGFTIKDMSKNSFLATVHEIENLFLSQEKHKIRERCRNFIIKDRSVKNYQPLYSKIFNKI